MLVSDLDLLPLKQTIHSSMATIKHMASDSNPLAKNNTIRFSIVEHCYQEVQFFHQQYKYYICMLCW